MSNKKIIDFTGQTLLPEKFYEACVTYNIITYFKEYRDEIIYPFSVSPVKEKQEGYDFGYQGKKIFLMQYKRPNINRCGCRWDIDLEQLNRIVNNSYGKFTYYALPQFDNYMLWYHALHMNNIKFIDAITLKRYLAKTGKKSISSECKDLKDWDQVVYELFNVNSYKSAVEIDYTFYIRELMSLLQLEGIIAYEVI